MNREEYIKFRKTNNVNIVAHQYQQELKTRIIDLNHMWNYFDIKFEITIVEEIKTGRILDIL